MCIDFNINSLLNSLLNLLFNHFSSKIAITLFGDKGKGKETWLNKTGFEKGKIKQLKFKSSDVGGIQKIRVITINLLII